MTDIKNIKRFLNPKKHIIQVWSSTLQSSIADVVQAGFKTIFTNWNTLYLDCGMGSWVGEVRNYYKNISHDRFHKIHALAKLKKSLNLILSSLTFLDKGCFPYRVVKVMNYNFKFSSES